jgi:hypothetical protein
MEAEEKRRSLIAAEQILVAVLFTSTDSPVSTISFTLTFCASSTRISAGT